MVKFFRIKEKARDLARQQKFDLALAEYRAAISLAEKDNDTAALRNLYNAAGDAALQKNDMPLAVEYFFKAADSYVEEGLYDNAIALCHKILRNIPTKAEAYARLGTIYGEKGLRNQALQNWLEFAERREKAGDVSGVTRALREVVTLSPDRDAVREQLVGILLSQGDKRGALAELDELKARADAAGDRVRAEDLTARLDLLREELGLRRAEEREGAPHAAQPGTLPSEAEFAGAENGAHDREPGELVMERFEPLESLTSDREPGTAPAGSGLPGLDSGFGFSSSEPSLAPPGEVGRPTGPRAPTGGPPPDADRELTIGSLPGLTPVEAGGQPSAPEAGGPPVSIAPIADAAPQLDIAPIAYVPVEQRIARAEARLAQDPGDAEERIYLGELYQESGEIERARTNMEQGALELLQAGQAEKAYRAFIRVAALAKEDLETVQKLVEVAHATGSREHLLQSYELLADRLMEAGQYGRAAEIHRQILAIEPTHHHSQDQLLILEGLDVRVPGEPAAAEADLPEEPYVDLGALLAEGEAAAGEPQLVASARAEGAEGSELTQVIEDMRRGVTGDIDEGDLDSHYDLGVAFRDMGLLDQAIREFQLAARGDVHRERAFELMGLCFLEKGMTSVAVNCFRRGLESESDPHDALGLRYHLGRSLEELGDTGGARAEYEKVVALDVQFLDAAERLQKLA